MSDPASAIQFPAYRIADQILLEEVFRARRESDNLLSMIQMAESEHDGPIRSVGGKSPYDAPFQTYAADSSMSIEAIESMDFDAYSRMLSDLVEQFAQSLGGMFVAEVGAIADHVGNVVDQKGKTLLEGLREGFMRKQYDFDEDGQLKQMTICVPEGHEAEFASALAILEEDPDIAARVLQQREEFLKNRPRRRLLSPC